MFYHHLIGSHRATSKPRCETASLRTLGSNLGIDACAARMEVTARMLAGRWIFARAVTPRALGRRQGTRSFAHRDSSVAFSEPLAVQVCNYNITTWTTSSTNIPSIRREY